MMAEILLRVVVGFAIGHAPNWLLGLFVSPACVLAAEYVLLAMLAAVVTLVARADLRRKGA